MARRQPDFAAPLAEYATWAFSQDGYNIDGSIYAEQDADSAVLWAEDGTPLEAWERTRRGNWRSVPC